MVQSRSNIKPEDICSDEPQRDYVPLTKHSCTHRRTGATHADRFRDDFFHPHTESTQFRIRFAVGLSSHGGNLYLKKFNTEQNTKGIDAYSTNNVTLLYSLEGLDDLDWERLLALQ
ncbi:hypothetical protein QJS10_CPB21g01605 [Acorus calamus]|uniref:Uncharacterized protein n=1 Tax=Acorus calamus TaxID=4465 RepID=A0AAV9C529_ACOCL|nr:hypothetical protein QJS10_CPB21g01605 [Acorus calamus]